MVSRIPLCSSGHFVIRQNVRIDMNDWLYYVQLSTSTVILFIISVNSNVPFSCDLFISSGFI